MVIGRDIIPVHIINTYTQFPATTGGGAGTKFIQMSTAPVSSGAMPAGSSSQALEFKWGVGGSSTSIGAFAEFDGIFDDGSGDGILNDLSEEIETYLELAELEEHDFGYSEIESGGVTRTRVHVPVSRQEFILNGGAVFHLHIGSYLRGWDDASTANNSGVSALTWTVGSGALISSTITNGSLSLINSDATRDNTQDNRFATNSLGIYHSSPLTTGLYKLIYTCGGGRGSLTYPAVGDKFILRIKADGSVGGTAVSQRIIDLEIKWI